MVTGTERQVTLRTLSPASVETVRHAFHEPPRWDEIRLNAARQRSVVLRGPAGSGKTAAAVRLLQAQQVRAWYLLDSVADLARIAGLDELDADAGLLLNSPGTPRICAARCWRAWSTSSNRPVCGWC